MVEYRRIFRLGGWYFFTQVTYERRAWLCTPAARATLHNAIISVRDELPFVIAAWVLLPEHLHCIWQLPEGDSDYSTRWRLIKTFVRKHGEECWRTTEKSASRKARHEQALWQRRFWEHTIPDDEDYRRHCDYIHYNPVKHGLCLAPRNWPYSSFHRFVKEGRYESNWGNSESPEFPEGIGKE
jgi:REP-associated tyrosine transposase